MVRKAVCVLAVLILSLSLLSGCKPDPTAYRWGWRETMIAPDGTTYEENRLVYWTYVNLGDSIGHLGSANVYKVKDNDDLTMLVVGSRTGEYTTYLKEGYIIPDFSEDDVAYIFLTENIDERETLCVVENRVLINALLENRRQSQQTIPSQYYEGLFWGIFASKYSKGFGTVFSIWVASDTKQTNLTILSRNDATSYKIPQKLYDQLFNLLQAAKKQAASPSP